MNHLDMEQLNELKEVLEDEFQVLINTYLIDAQLRLKLIEEGLDTKNYEQVRLAAHSLKGASANIGALILAQLCEQLEHDCKVGKSDLSDTKYYAINNELKIIEENLKVLL